MSTRDELASDLSSLGLRDASCDRPIGTDHDGFPIIRRTTVQEFARYLEESGWRKHRMVNTAEELDALPEETIILDSGVTAVKICKSWYYATGAFEPNLPATVLWSPDE